MWDNDIVFVQQQKEPEDEGDEEREDGEEEAEPEAEEVCWCPIHLSSK